MRFQDLWRQLIEWFESNGAERQRVLEVQRALRVLRSAVESGDRGRQWRAIDALCRVLRA